MDRREFLGRTGALCGMAALGMDASHAEAGRAKAPYKLLYNNDCTNIMTCVSPYHAKGEAITTAMIQATVDEAAGVDAHLLMPGMGWVPWWKSAVLPIERQHAWFKEHYGIEPKNSYHDYLLAGGDIVQVFVDRCRERGQAPFISFRLNDGHHLERLENPSPFNVQSLTQFYVEHPEYRIGPDIRDWYQHVQNWAIPEVRDYKFAFIRELCENYDLDGFELDFMRHPSYFNVAETTPEERAAVMTGFVRRVRALLDRTAKPGQRRWLSARVPCWLDTCGALGIDLAAMYAAGLDMVNVSPFYFTRQYHDLAQIRPLVPEAALYLEMTHAATAGPAVGKGYDNFSFRRANEHILYTTARLAYEAGADGVSFFNFVYYREHGTPNRGPFNEPPFYTFPHLKDPAWLAQQPQWYYLGEDWNNPRREGWQLKRKFEPGASHTFTMRCAPAPGLADGTFRIMTGDKQNGCAWKATLNGVELTPIAQTSSSSSSSSLLPSNFTLQTSNFSNGGLGQPDQYACFACPLSAVQPGGNAIALTLETGGPVTVTYMDLTLPRGTG